jgi:hypothetical protein
MFQKTVIAPLVASFLSVASSAFRPEDGGCMFPEMQIRYLGDYILCMIYLTTPSVVQITQCRVVGL